MKEGVQTGVQEKRTRQHKHRAPTDYWRSCCVVLLCPCLHTLPYFPMTSSKLARVGAFHLAQGEESAGWTNVRLLCRNGSVLLQVNFASPQRRSGAPEQFNGRGHEDPASLHLCMLTRFFSLTHALSCDCFKCDTCIFECQLATLFQMFLLCNKCRCRLTMLLPGATGQIEVSKQTKICGIVIKRTVKK